MEAKKRIENKKGGYLGYSIRKKQKEQEEEFIEKINNLLESETKEILAITKESFKKLPFLWTVIIFMEGILFFGFFSPNLHSSEKNILIVFMVAISIIVISLTLFTIIRIKMLTKKLQKNLNY
jgi:hypothetical protein